MKKWIGKVLCTFSVILMTFFNFYRFQYEGAYKQFVYDSMDCQAWIIILAYSFINGISRTFGLKWYTNPLINALFVLNIGCCLEWLVKIYAADQTKKYSVDWPIAGIFISLSVAWLIIEVIITRNQTYNPSWIRRLKRKKTKT